MARTKQTARESHHRHPHRRDNIFIHNNLLCTSFTRRRLRLNLLRTITQLHYH